jgi:(p)ppGpp synthase/HD superfamily hydrolase
MDQLELAEDIARLAHKDQKRFDGKPYITHVERVVASVYTYDEKVIAWLHDVMEDTDIDSGDLMDRGIDFAYVSTLINLTHEKGELYNDYIGDIVGDELAMIVKIADIVDNITDTPSKRQIQKYKDALTKLTLSRGVH